MSAILQGILGNAAYEFLKKGLEKVPILRSTIGEFRVVYYLIVNFYEMPPYDNAERILTEILQNHTESAGILRFDKCRFNYLVSWDEYEGCIAPQYPWMADVIVDQEELNKFFSEEEYLAVRCVSGLILRISSISSQVDIEDILMDGYLLLNAISNDLKREMSLRIRSTVNIANIIASKDTNNKIRSRLEKLLKKRDLEITIRLEDIFNKHTLLTIYLKDKLEVLLLVEAIKSRWIF